LIRERRIGSLRCDWVAAHFRVLTNAVAPFEVSELDVAIWMTPWDVHIEKACRDVLKTDDQLIRIVMASDEKVLPKTREGLLKQVTIEERTCEEWVQLIMAGEKQYLSIVDAVMQRGISIPTIDAVNDALIQVLNSLA